MKLQNLISLLKSQEDNLKNLLKIGLNKKDVLVSGDNEKLIEIIQSEEQSLLTLQLNEESRLKIMHDLFKEYNIDNERYKLKVLIENLTGKVNSKLLIAITNSEKTIKKMISEITRLNQLNMLLIQQSRSIINETIQAVINSSKRSIVDRKG